MLQILIKKSSNFNIFHSITMGNTASFWLILKSTFLRDYLIFFIAPKGLLCRGVWKIMLDVRPCASDVTKSVRGPVFGQCLVHFACNAEPSGPKTGTVRTRAVWWENVHSIWIIVFWRWDHQRIMPFRIMDDVMADIVGSQDSDDVMPNSTTE